MESRIQKKPRHHRRRQLIILGLCLIVVLGGSLVITSKFKLKNFVVEGCTRYTEEQIKDKLVTKKADQISILLYLRYKFGHHNTIPYIEKYVVSMQDNNTIKVKVYEKKIIGCVELMGSYMYFDKDGMVVESSKERLDRIPLVTGLKFEKIVLNEPLVIQKQSLYDTILNLTNCIQKYDLSMDKIFINSSYEVTLYDQNNQYLLGKKEYYDHQLNAISDILKTAVEKKLCYDLRYYEENEKKITAKPIK